MTNEQKADEICKRHIFDSNHFDCCMEMAEWKDEQFLQWLKENLAKETSTMFTSESQGVINFEPVIKAFEKFIKQ